MSTQSVQICFATEENAPSLASCLEQLLWHVNLESQEEN